MNDCITEESGAKLEGVIRGAESEIRSHLGEVSLGTGGEVVNLLRKKRGGHPAVRI